MRKYILAPDGMTPVAVPEDDLKVWGAWFETGDRVLARTDLGLLGQVSTVFLGLDHRFTSTWPAAGGGGLPPLLWETMVFDPDGQEDGCWRDSSWARAAARHRMVTRRFLRHVAKFGGDERASLAASYLGDAP